ncbi:MAG: FAD-dependent oxidoreductase, partial [Candidatus Omnitrophica bacterium]|nr:FAD-dependent oxidoreductase [Candidatus Omnitrophota bacterium]
MEKYDVSILGAGPGGYVAALYAAQLGMKVCLIEEDTIGGVCLNYGCIPTKALVASAKALSCIRNSENLGISVENVTFNFQIIAKRKKEIVEKLKNGTESLLKARKVIIKRGKGILIDKNAIRVEKDSIQSKYIIIATGSGPVDMPFAKFDGRSILSSKEMLEL